MSESGQAGWSSRQARRAFVPRVERRVISGMPVSVTRVGEGRPLIFLQGFGVRPRFYQTMFDALASRGYAIYAPDLLRPACLTQHPATIPACAQTVMGMADLYGLERFAIAGHSLGGAVSYTLSARSPRVTHVVGLNPALPVDFGLRRAVSRSLVKGARAQIGLAGGWRGVAFASRFNGPLVAELATAPRTTLRLLKSLKHFDYALLNVTQPALLYFGDRDEFFSLDPPLEDSLHEGFERLRILKVQGLVHDWPIFKPNHAARVIHDFITDAASVSAAP